MGAESPERKCPTQPPPVPAAGAHGATEHPIVVIAAQKTAPHPDPTTNKTDQRAVSEHLALTIQYVSGDFTEPLQPDLALTPRQPRLAIAEHQPESANLTSAPQ